MEPALELVMKGDIDYLIFECLAERTIADAQRKKLEDPLKGYNPMLRERMEVFLPLMKTHNFKIVSNMGGANTSQAVTEIVEIAEALGVTGLKIAAVLGDDITSALDQYKSVPLWNQTAAAGSLSDVISANVYLGADGILQALDEGADIVITGRVADPALFVGPILHEFRWHAAEYGKIGQALLTGHLMECCAQLTGGYYADPGYKEVPDLHRLGHPIAEINEAGEVFFTKVKGSGGCVTIDICKEQLLYEIGDPSFYITPDGIADFSKVVFTETEPDVIAAVGALSRGLPETYKVNIGYMNGYMGVGEVSFGGSNALERAELAADIIIKRWDIIGIKQVESRIDYIGFNSLYKTAISEKICTGNSSEIRLRIAVRTITEEDALRLIREVQCLYINGPAGSSGIASNVESILSIENISVPRNDITFIVIVQEV